MKSTGVVRRVDELGRIVLPIELRRTLDIKATKDKMSNTAMEIYTEGDSIVLRKYEPTCIFCGEGKNIINFKGKNVCRECLKDIKGNPVRKDSNSICR